jgi:hypothetical protein
MEQEFGYFRAAPRKYESSDPRCKILPWVAFDALKNWQVDRHWTKDEKVALGILVESVEIDGDGFRDLIREAKEALDALQKELS